MNRLIVMTKYPEPGQTKTRLIPALGVGGAAKLHRRLVIHTVKTIGSFNPEIHYSGGSQRLMYDWLGDFKYVNQSDGDLGDRMKQAFQLGFDQGCDRIIMIGTDCPAIDKALIDRAFVALNRKDVIFGPAVDGGYYLIGLTKQIPELFSNISWSTTSVLQDSLAIVKKLNLSYELLEILPDIDRPEDLQYLKADSWLANIGVADK